MRVSGNVNTVQTCANSFQRFYFTWKVYECRGLHTSDVIQYSSPHTQRKHISTLRYCLPDAHTNTDHPTRDMSTHYSLPMSNRELQALKYSDKEPHTHTHKLAGKIKQEFRSFFLPFSLPNSNSRQKNETLYRLKSFSVFAKSSCIHLLIYILYQHVCVCISVPVINLCNSLSLGET